jgi:hypothetical protein
MHLGDVYFLVYGSVVVKGDPTVRWELLAQFISLDGMNQAMAREDDYPRTRDYRIVRCEVIK